jgi:hypothetical protein
MRHPLPPPLGSLASLALRALLVVLGVFGMGLLLTGAMGACENVPIDNGPGGRVEPPAGVIEGTVVYQGPPPCTANGQVVGNLILLFFAQDNPPPPAGVASTAVQIGVVAGDVLFQNQPRYSGSTAYCPPTKDGDAGVTITASAPFAVSPFAAGTYIVEAFFDYTGEFLPTFKFRQLPEMGDVAGGYIDTTDAILHASEGVDYKPIFLPITVGVPAGSTDAGADAAIGAGLDGGSLVLPASGFVANNITVSVGSVLPIPRPYFYINGVTGPAASPMPTTANPDGGVDYVPAVTMAQDIQILAQPLTITPANVMTFQNSLVSMSFLAGVPQSELSAAIDPSGPFQFQLTPEDDAQSLFVWTDGTKIPENSLVDNLLPQVVFSKLIDDPTHIHDPQSIIQQVPPVGPIVVILAVNMGPETSLLDLLDYTNVKPGPDAAVGQVNTLVRPLAVCVDPTHPENGATIATPFLMGQPAGGGGDGGPVALFNETAIIAALTPIFGTINPIVPGCIPPGRYAANFVYPTGEAWTVPNESGSCAAGEGPLTMSSASPTGWVCANDAGTPRDVLYSQGTRAVLEVTETQGSAICAANPVPAACVPPTN